MFACACFTTEVSASALPAVLMGLCLGAQLCQTLPPLLVPAGASGPAADVKRVAELTVKALMRTVPPAVPGIMFLSGGQARASAPEPSCEAAVLHAHPQLWVCAHAPFAGAPAVLHAHPQLCLQTLSRPSPQAGHVMMCCT
jgi:hypothetical protein